MTKLYPWILRNHEKYGISSERPIICVRILNYANYHVYSITYTFNISKLIFSPSYFALDARKACRSKRYVVDIKTYLHDVNNVT